MQRDLHVLYKILQFCSHHDMHIRDISKILLNINFKTFNVSTTIYQIAQSLILKLIFCCNIVFYKSSSLIKLLTKTILVNWTLPKMKAMSQWWKSYSVTELCQISEELRFCFLKNYFDTQDFWSLQHFNPVWHCRWWTIQVFSNLFWNSPYLAHSAQKQVIGLGNSLD